MSNIAAHVAGQLIRREPVKTFQKRNGTTGEQQVIHVRVDTVYEGENPVVMEYEQVLSLTVRQDGLKHIPAKDGQRVSVKFNVQGREWTSPQGELKVFNTLDVWRIQPEVQAEKSQTTQQTPAPVADVVEDDDLPF